MRGRRRMYDSDTMANGVGVVAKLQQKALQIAPTSFGPLAKIAPQVNPVEELEGHCLKCKGKKKFQVEGEQKMKNGAVRKYGKCQEAGCGTMISHFVAGAKEGTAA